MQQCLTNRTDYSTIQRTLEKQCSTSLFWHTWHFGHIPHWWSFWLHNHADFLIRVWAPICLWKSVWCNWPPNKAAVCLPYCHHLSKIKLILVDLSDEDGCHRFIESSAVHVDGGTHGQDKACNLSFYMTVLQQALHCNGQRGRTVARIILHEAMKWHTSLK